MRNNCCNSFTEKVTCVYKFPSGQVSSAIGYLRKERRLASDAPQDGSANSLSTIWNSTITEDFKIRLSHSKSRYDRTTTPLPPVFDGSLMVCQVLRLRPLVSSATRLPPASGYGCGLCWCEKTFRHVQAAGGHLSYTSYHRRLHYVQEQESRASYDCFSLSNRTAGHQTSNSLESLLYKIFDHNQLRNYLMENVISFTYGGTLVSQGFIQTPQSQLLISHDFNSTIVKLGESLT